MPPPAPPNGVPSPAASPARPGPHERPRPARCTLQVLGGAFVGGRRSAEAGEADRRLASAAAGSRRVGALPHLQWGAQSAALGEKRHGAGPISPSDDVCRRRRRSRRRRARRAAWALTVRVVVAAAANDAPSSRVGPDGARRCRRRALRAAWALTVRVVVAAADNDVGGSAHALVWLLQCISRVPPRGAPGECAIPDWRRTVERLVLLRLRLHRPFRGKGNGKALCAAKSLRPGLLFVQFGINRSIQCSERCAIAAQKAHVCDSDVNSDSEGRRATPVLMRSTKPLNHAWIECSGAPEGPGRELV